MHARNAARIAGRLLLLPLMVATLAGPASATSSRRVRRARTRDDVVQGQVVDAQGAGIAGATVRIVELGIEVTADQSGNFSIEAVPAGSWSLEVRRPGYQTELTRLTVPSTGRLAIRLVVDPSPSTRSPSRLHADRSTRTDLRCPPRRWAGRIWTASRASRWRRLWSDLQVSGPFLPAAKSASR